MKWYSPLLLTGLLLVPATPAAGQTSLSLTGGINVASLEVDSSDSLVPNLQSVSRISIGLAATIPTSELRLSLILRAQLNARQDSDPE